MKRHRLQLAVLFVSIALLGATAQESPYVLNRAREISLPVDAAWKNSVAIVRAAPAIVNTIDPISHLVTFTMPLSSAEVKDDLLDPKSLEKQPLTLHTTIWLTGTAANKSRVYVRSAPSGAGFFSHSNGLVESRILDAIERGETSIIQQAQSVSNRMISSPPHKVQEAALAAIAGSKQLVLNAAAYDPGVVTFSLMVPTVALADFTYSHVTRFYPGVEHLTMWFQPSDAGTTIVMRALMLESGSLSPQPLISNGTLEAVTLEAIQKQINGNADGTIRVGSDFRGKQEFWNVLFGMQAITNGGEPRPSLVRDLPVTLEQAWTAALHVITQTRIVTLCDRTAGRLEFVTAHTSQVGTQYSVHRIAVEFAPEDYGVRMTMLIPQSQETSEEASNDLKLYSEQIGADLFIKERLKWLTGGKVVK